jgi:tRNA(adenine34) deaminase
VPNDADISWSALPLAWRRAFERAWASWCSGSAGVGATITNSEGAIVAEGQNSVLDQPGGPGLLAGTAMAHAEMNALASLPSATCPGFTLYTTFEPCLMCSATIIGTYQSPRVAFAAYDPTWDGLPSALRQCTAVAGLLPKREHLGGPFGTLAYVVHIASVIERLPGGLDAHHGVAPERLALCRSLVQQGTLSHLARRHASVADVADALWTDLCRLTTAIV